MKILDSKTPWPTVGRMTQATMVWGDFDVPIIDLIMRGRSEFMRRSLVEPTHLLIGKREEAKLKLESAIHRDGYSLPVGDNGSVTKFAGMEIILTLENQITMLHSPQP